MVNAKTSRMNVLFILLHLIAEAGNTAFVASLAKRLKNDPKQSGFL
jgi:hypothetical protein